ncbi:zinc finger protein 26-like isoform X3 [Plodia interpunctella]|uniref:zinc finger protein 26-like isoform X3 n=1 Tax=Plodia interpunctella TaxID=58824 RepID=UPI002368AE2C|nr:zinc finger protein 26-like isoform X3 [Plodia interpunctella]XP_053623412.1 zinc finger protein 26-like isoform X3 [Plodia interpunctella]
MAAKSSEWRPGPTVCRCCLTEGCYKDISTEYFWMGKREVYAEMLKETLEVTISYSKTGGPNSNSRLICEPCISRLRDATEFKRQVVECERVFMQHLDPGSTSLDIEVDSEPMEKIKIEGVKLEKSHSDDEEFGDRHFGDDDDDDDDDLDNQPLTKLASRVPKKESVDLLDLLDTSKPAQKRKSTVKVKPPPSKKAKTKIEAAKAKPSSSKAKPEKKKKGAKLEIHGRCDETKKKIVLVYRTPQRRNAELILKFSTAYPFKTRFYQILCAYCHEDFDTLVPLRAHMSEHQNSDFKNVFYRIKDNLINVDITDLKCKICSVELQDVDTLMAHLSQDHGKSVKFNSRFGVLPFKQDFDNRYVCVYCQRYFTDFVLFKKHINTHFMNFSCDKCGTMFVSEHALRDHHRQVKCFRTAYKARNGRDLKPRTNAQIILQYSTACPFRTWMNNFNCIFCRVQSNDPISLRNHMATRHANYDVNAAFYKKLGKEFLKIDITDLQCKLCFMAIDNFDTLTYHLKNDHQQPINSDAQLGVLPFRLNDGSVWKCTMCQNEFKDFVSLKKHTSEHFQNYVCDTCGEGFITESAMVAHTKVPHENKYSCSRCVATFTTLDERNIHLKTQHTNMPYMCTYCKEKPRFSNWELRKKHLIEVHNYKTGADKYECTTCQKTFKTRSGKYNHMARTHRVKKDSELNYLCAHCPKAFTTKLFLDKHTAKKHFDM